MHNLKSILNDFHHCLNIPIKFFDKQWDFILEKGHFKTSEYFFVNLDILEICKKDDCSYLEINNNNIHFFKLNFVIKENLHGYFIVGPFKSCSSNFNKITFKPYTCISYIKNFLYSLMQDKFPNTHSFSTYVAASISYIHKNYYKDICIDDICRLLKLNKSYFCSLFKKETGLTFCNFLNKFRIEMSKKYLYDKTYSILDVSLNVGYNNHNYYSQLFKKLNKITPIEFRNLHFKKMPQ